MPKYKLTPSTGARVPTHVFLEEQVYGLSFHITEEMRDTAIGEKAGRPHRHPFYSIQFVRHADGKHYVDYAVSEKIQDRVFLLSPGQMHHWEGVGNIRGRLLCFDEEFLADTTPCANAAWEAELFGEMSAACPGGIPLPAREVARLEQLLDWMLQEYNERQLRYTQILRDFLNAFLAILFRVYRQMSLDAVVGKTLLSAEYQKLVNQHLTSHLPMKYFADALGVSVSYLNDQVKKQTGLTPGELRRRTLMQEAKRMLANTSLSITEIADRLGYEDNAYFCRVFKKETGMPPSRFRQRCLQRVEWSK